MRAGVSVSVYGVWGVGFLEWIFELYALRHRPWGCLVGGPWYGWGTGGLEVVGRGYGRMGRWWCCRIGGLVGEGRGGRAGVLRSLLRVNGWGGMMKGFRS